MLVVALGLGLFGVMARTLGRLGAELLAPALEFRAVVAEVLFMLVMVELVRLLTIPKASRPPHAAENAGAGDLPLTEAELARIDEAFPLGPPPRELPVL